MSYYPNVGAPGREYAYRVDFNRKDILEEKDANVGAVKTVDVLVVKNVVDAVNQQLAVQLLLLVYAVA